jgi:hypothetical protein
MTLPPQGFRILALPQLGADTDDILRTPLCLDAEAIAARRRAGVV